MHVASVSLFEGPAPDLRGVLASTFAPACTSSRDSGRSCASCRSARAARSGSTTRASTSPTTCATRPCPSPGPRSSCETWRRAIFSQRLDRSKPIWELWLVDGVEGGRFAVDRQDRTTAWSTASPGSTSSTVLFDAEAEPEAVPSPSPGSRGPSRATPRCSPRRSSSAPRRPAEVGAGRAGRCSARRAGRPRGRWTRSRPPARSRARAWPRRSRRSTSRSAPTGASRGSRPTSAA